MELLDGKMLSAKIKEDIKKEVDEMVNQGLRPPHLSAILVGDDPASHTYVNSKMKSCEQIGFKSSLIRYDSSVSEEELLAKVEECNNDKGLDGFIVQLPLPDHIDENKVIESINPEKDVDGFHPINIGRISKGIPAFIPATPKGILEFFKHYNIETSGKHCVVIGRSNIVGTPMSILMSRKDYPGNCTVTTCHSRTKNIGEIVKTADIIIAAIGKAFFVTEDMLKEGAVIIDVGMNAIEDKTKKRGYRLVGDVDFENVSKKASYITPVPGGVGLMTVTALLQNTLIAAKNSL
jgi:methylenetetrahydrofolate dehydrogenase (NADP+)/methenyltetrahydrofolate cyclohydrolase